MNWFARKLQTPGRKLAKYAFTLWPISGERGIPAVRLTLPIAMLQRVLLICMLIDNNLKYLL